MKKISKQLVALFSLSILLLVCMIASLHWLDNLSVRAEEVAPTEVYNATNTYDAEVDTKE